jgi:hypothetical protein
MKMVFLKIVIGVFFVFIGFGQTLMIRPAIAVYVSSDLVLNGLHIVFGAIGSWVVYYLSMQNITKKKSET